MDIISFDPLNLTSPTPNKEYGDDVPCCANDITEKSKNMETEKRLIIFDIILISLVQTF